MMLGVEIEIRFDDPPGFVRTSLILHVGDGGGVGGDAEIIPITGAPFYRVHAVIGPRG
jgi:hypothetical protein